MATKDQLRIGDSVEHISFNHDRGKIEGLGTELGPDYLSVRFNNTTRFCTQVHKDNLIKIS